MVATGRAGAGYTGVQIRDSGSVRVQVPFGGRWVWEPVPFASTAAGLKQAARLRQEVIDRARIGHIVWSEWFPDSIRSQAAEEPKKREPTFREAGEAWIRRAASRLTLSTVKGYRKRLNGIWYPKIGNRTVSSVTHGDILDVVAANGWKSGKTQENALSVAKSVFEEQKREGWVAVNPVEGVKTKKSRRKAPDPLSREECAAVLDWLARRGSPWWPYFAVALATGMRPSELAALQWADIDWIGTSIHVSRGVVESQIGETKTEAGERSVPMLPLALAGLRAQKPVTQMKQPEVFTQPATGSPLQDEQPARRAWTTALKGAGVRHRKAYSTRHTFASRLIMHGTQFMQVSRWLGHANPAMTLSAYARWIEGELSEPLAPEEVWPAPAHVPTVFQQAGKRA